MPEHQKAQKRTQQIQSLQDKRRNLQKESLAAWKEERFRLLSDKVGKNRMADAEMEAELQGLQAGEEGRSSNASQAVDCCLETMVEQVFAVGPDHTRSTFDALCQIFFRGFETFTPPALMPRGEEGRRDSGNEQEQGRASQQLVLPTPGGVNQDAPASSSELDLPRVRSVLGNSGSAGRSGAQVDRKRGPSRSPGRTSMDEDDDNLGGLVP